MTVKIIGAGLAGCEAAWQLINRGIAVTIFEMRPEVPTKAHQTDLFAELVCSNSLRGAALRNAVGLLKEELKLSNSLIMEAALLAEVPAGGALAVDRNVFSEHITKTLKEHPLVTVINEEVSEIPESSTAAPVIIATGPLTSRPLSQAIENLTGTGNLAFFDAVSPIVIHDSLDHDKVFRQSRYDKGGDDYLNIPLDRDLYYWFVDEVQKAEKYTGNIAVENDSLDKLRPFEGCMPIEEMIDRGPETLRFGPFKPKGLRDPRSQQRPYAVLQLRQDDKAGSLWNMVGMQTRMKRGEQKRIFSALPGLEKAEFVRYGCVHRNTFIDGPRCLDATLEFRQAEGLLFAGQITGVEGYVESTAGGLVAGINAARLIGGEEPVVFPPETAIGALMNYISSDDRKEFQPMNISYGLIPAYANRGRLRNGKKIPKKELREIVAKEALATLQNFNDKLTQ